MDMNAYQGTLADFQAQVSTGAQTGGNPTLTEGDTGPAVQTLQTRLNVWVRRSPSTATSVPPPWPRSRRSRPRRI